MRSMLRGLGFRSEIFADLIDRRVAREARPADELARRTGDGSTLLYHLSIGSPLARMVEGFEGPRVLVYHNITPPDFYRGTSPRVVYWLERGERELRRLAPLADLVIGDSTYNLEAPLAAGARRHAVVPPPVDLSRLAPRAARPARPPVVLFVGRLAPNKRQEELIRVLAALRATAAPDARLVLAGSADDTGGYLAGLRRLAERLGVADAVDIPARRLSDVELGAHYAAASAFACASDHEGFCIPLLEAMAFSVPVVAHAAGAVPETLGDAGVLVRDRDPLVWAGLLGRVLTDQRLRATLTAAGRRRLEDFSTAATTRRLEAALREIGVVAPDSRPRRWRR
ncbi:MAG TPA: glycosyltransferase [Candidatus Dormibacteraeota bacterium]|nr:glycosyltransferase [Candidatus Dormibacteraeota bacterium]